MGQHKIFSEDLAMLELQQQNLLRWPERNGLSTTMVCDDVARRTGSAAGAGSAIIAGTDRPESIIRTMTTLR